MSNHLPECPAGPGRMLVGVVVCQCEIFRACEKRVTHKEFLFDEGDPYREVYRSGYRKGLAAAREVVSWAHAVYEALDAIDGLVDMDDPAEPLGMPEPPPDRGRP